MKSRISFFSHQTISISCRARHTALGVPYKGATGRKENMKNVNSGSHKKPAVDTRNNWVTMMFKTKCNYNCFEKQSHIDTCIQAFRDFERLGFEFHDFGFGGSHVHFPVNVPKKYSIQTAETMLKSSSAKKMFKVHPGFRKRYPRGSFWSGYEHHESTGLIDLEKSIAYCQSQQQRHGITVIDDRQQKLPGFAAE
jgi:REP element-mobilizing transposase RayT